MSIASSLPMPMGKVDGGVFGADGGGVKRVFKFRQKPKGGAASAKFMHLKVTGL